MERFGAFERVSVVELSGSAAGAYCAKMFADLGAEVTFIGEPLAGPGAAFYNTSKRLVASDEPAVAELVATADVVIQSSSHEAIDQPIEQASAEQIVARISPFAPAGPYAEWRSSDLVDSAISGHLRLSGDPDREPLQGVPDLVHHAAGVTSFVATVAALIARVRIGVGQIVEVTHQEVLTALHQFTLGRYTHNGAVLNRLGNRYAGPGAPIGAYECAGGWIGLALPQEDQLERMLEVTGLITMLDRPDVDSMWDLMTNPGLLDEELIPYLKTQDRDETVELFQALRLPCAPIAELIEVLADPHLAEREFWRSIPEAADDAGGDLQTPGPPFRLSGHGWSIGAKPKQESLPAGADELASLADGPLTGFRVLDMTRVWAGPLAARILADLGAEVLMTEVPWTRTPLDVPKTYVDGTHFFPDDEAGERPWNRSCFHNKYASNKLSTVIELDKEDGRELFAALVPTADVLIENYSPRVMPGFGFDEDALARLNPNLVYITMPGYGRSGPHTDWVAYGPTIDGHVGHTSITGYRGEGPWKSGIAWPDPIGGLHGAAAAVVALLDRCVSPESGGQTGEVAQIESAVNMIGQHVVAAQLEPPAPRQGNRREGIAPQGVYRCAGTDRWIAISVLDDTAWRSLCEVLGLDDLVDLDHAKRAEQHDLLDRRIASATADLDDMELMWTLQTAGVAAGAVTDAADVMDDPQLKSLDYFVQLTTVDAGSHPWPRFPARLSATPASLRTPAPAMGEHNQYAVLELAGYSEASYRALLDVGIVRTGPPG